LGQERKPTTWLSLGREGRSDARVVAESDKRAPRGAGCKKFPSGNLLVAESHPGHYVGNVRALEVRLASLGD
jgi:hypothetical protein